MASQTNYPGTVADDASVGDVAWSNPSNATTDNGVFATDNPGAALTTHYLKGTNFGFTVPAGSTINGIKLEVKELDPNDLGGSISDNSIRLVKGGVISGDDKSGGAGAAWPGASSYVTYGVGNTDMWGLTLTAADVNGSTFGAVVSAQETSGLAGETAEVDTMRITVYYTPPASARNWGTVIGV